MLLFIALFCGVGFTLTALGEAKAFYQLPAVVALLPALALALWLAHRKGAPALDRLLAGMGERDVQLMLLIFLLSGAFAVVSRATGGVDAVVGLGLSVIPPALILPGIFLLAVAIAMALGTSMGTIAAVSPIALGLGDAAGFDKALVLGAVLSGATLGDNLSIISDTSIAAARSLGTTARAKFLENLKFAVPAGLGTLGFLAAAGEGATVPAFETTSVWLALPYAVVLALAVLGLNVLAVLALGVVLAGVMGGLVGGYGVFDFTGDVHEGFLSVTDTLLVSLLVAGLGALIRADGGFAWLIARIEALAKGRRGARTGQLGIAGLAVGSDALLANNTVAILLTGPIAREIADAHGVSRARAASVIDIFACVTQSLLPWGAQILLAASLGGVSPLDLAGSLHYCWLLGGITLGWVLLERRGSGTEQAAQVGEVFLERTGVDGDHALAALQQAPVEQRR